MMDKKKNLNVLVVGQTPPPFGGQAVMIQQLMDAQMDGVRFHHVRMAFSDDMDSIGRFQFKKIRHLAELVFKVAAARVRYRTPVLYYPPAGPNRVPFYRDAVLLILTRWMFSKTVFHFHASGISTLYDRLGRLEQLAFRLAYHRPALAIRTSALNPDDGEFLEAERSVVVENGLPDMFPAFSQQVIARVNHTVPRILFVGALYESKGILDLVEACLLLKQSGVKFELECVGRFESSVLERTVLEKINQAGMQDQTFFPGVLSGDAKWSAYARADIFCFPTYFESESFGLVNVEAMQFELPVVSTRWRGVPGVIRDQQNGFLVEIRSPRQIAERLACLIKDRTLRAGFGAVGRTLYQERFSDLVWRTKMSGLLKEISV